jgi:hypothetical protein
MSEIDEQTTVPQLEEAFQGLLESRTKDPFLDGVDTAVHQDRGDDTFKEHMNTYEIFSSLKTRYSDLQKEINTIDDDNSILINANQNLERGYDHIKHVIGVYNKDMKLPQVDKYLNAFDELKKLNRSTNESILTIMNAKKNTLEAENDNISRKLNALRKYITAGIGEMVNKDELNKKFCPVCFDREVNIALVPCGHTYCSQCYECDKNTKCPQCRSYISSKVKLYFSM